MRFESNQMNKVALFFQSCYRGTQGRSIYDMKVKERNVGMVIKLQALFRRRLNFRIVAQQQAFMIQRRNKLAARIQKRHRGWAGRLRFKAALDLKLRACAIKIQASARARRGRELAWSRKVFLEEKRELERQKELERQMLARNATKIQSTVRRRAARDKFSILKELHVGRCIVLMQSVMRGRLGREKAARRRELVEEEERELEEARQEALREQEEQDRKEREILEKKLLAQRVKEMEEKREQMRKEAERERLRELVRLEEEAEEKAEIEAAEKASKEAQKKATKKKDDDDDDAKAPQGKGKIDKKIVNLDEGRLDGSYNLTNHRPIIKQMEETSRNTNNDADFEDGGDGSEGLDDLLVEAPSLKKNGGGAQIEAAKLEETNRNMNNDADFEDGGDGSEGLDDLE